jgi:hypothetical protein
MKNKIVQGAPDHAGVDQRNGFLPPRAIVARLRHDTPAGWASVPPVPGLTDLAGEALSDRAVIRLAYDDERLYLDAVVQERKPVIHPEWGPGTKHFWEQDHIELRFLRDPRHDLDQIQFIVSADGRAWDNRGIGERNPGAIRCSGRRTGRGWSVRLSCAFSDLGLPTPAAGSTWRGIVGHTRWGGGGLDIVCSGATELGFPQADRFGEWIFAGHPDPVFLESVSETGIMVVNRSRQPARGRLTIIREDGKGGATEQTKQIALSAGRNLVRLYLKSVFPAFARYAFRWQSGSGKPVEWGAVSLSGPLPPLSFSKKAQSRPGLLFDSQGLKAIRAKLAREPFKGEYGRFKVDPKDLTGEGLPGPDEPVSMAITKGCMNWFRVAKETMIRDGAGALKPAAAYIWNRQSKQAQQAWKNVVKTVVPTATNQDILIRELNGLLARRDFYDAGAFAEVHLPAEGRDLLARGIAKLRDDEVFRLNRIILQSSVECIGAFRTDLIMKPGSLWGAWLVTGDERLIATATRAVKAALRLTIMDHQIHLHEGMAAGSLALAYDSFHPYLSEEDRSVWRQLLMRFIRLYLETARRRSWTVTTIANANPVGNGGCGLAALAVLAECPEEALEALGYVRRYIRLWLDYCHGQDGGNTEGAQYWQYGVENFLRFARALERVTGSDDGMLAHPAVTKAMNMVRVGLCNDGALHGVNDTVPMPIGGAIGWFTAARFGDRLGLWYGDHALAWLRKRQAVGRPIAYDLSLVDMLLNRTAVPVSRRQPPLPEAFMLKDIHYGILRSGPRFDCRWTAGLKGSRPPYTHHNQRDTGAVFVDLGGERLIIDPGYYKPEPRDHTLPLIGGVGPVHPQAWTGTLTDCGKRGALRWLAADSTAAYGGKAKRVSRLLVMVGDEGLVMLDDIVAECPVTAQYTCGGVTDASPDGRAVTIQGNLVRLRMELLNRPETKVALHPERSLHDSHWGYHFADCRLFPVTADYQPSENEPLVTVLTEQKGRSSRRSSVSNENGRLIVRLPSGIGISFAYWGAWQLSK